MTTDQEQDINFEVSGYFIPINTCSYIVWVLFQFTISLNVNQMCKLGLANCQKINFRN